MKIKVTVKEHNKETVKIRTDFIQLQSLLKFKGKRAVRPRNLFKAVLSR